MRAAKQASQPFFTIINERVHRERPDGPFPCSSCGREFPLLNGLVNHNRRSKKCKGSRLDGSLIGYPFVAEHPYGSAKQRVISIPDSPPSPAKRRAVTIPDSPPPPAKPAANTSKDNFVFINSTPLKVQLRQELLDANSLENNMAFSDPAPPHDQHPMQPAGKRQRLLDVNIPDNNMMFSNPAPLQDQRAMSPAGMPQGLLGANIPENSMVFKNSAPLQDQQPMTPASMPQGLLESPMPNDAPLNAGGVTLQQGPGSLITTNLLWSSAPQSSFTASGVLAPSQEFITAQMRAPQMMADPGSPSSVLQEGPATTFDAGLVYATDHIIVPGIDQPFMPMGFETVFVKEPPKLPKNKVRRSAKTLPRAVQPPPPTRQPLPPAPAPHAQGPQVRVEPRGNGTGFVGNGNQPSTMVPAPSRDNSLYFTGTGQNDANNSPVPSAESMDCIPPASPPNAVPQAHPSSAISQGHPSSAIPQAYPSSAIPQASPSDGIPQAYPSSAIPHASPPGAIPQGPPSGATPPPAVDVSDGAGGVAPASPRPVASMNSPRIPAGQLPLPGGPSPVASMNSPRIPAGQLPLPGGPSPLASMNPPRIPAGQLPLPGGPRLGTSAVIIDLTQSPVLRPANEVAGAVQLRRSRVAKPNAPSMIIVLIQRNTCPTCKTEHPHPLEHDMKSHIRTELGYRTTVGQVIMLRGYNDSLPLAFTIDGQAYKNGLFQCPFCTARLTLVCGSHDQERAQAKCLSCKTYMAVGVTHLGAHLDLLKDPRLYVPSHHDSCPGPGAGCTCIPHYWTV
ncbi:unnamed protein product [Clonostachys rosea]|uniref:C2H2-type domain-containing protein n=1 Tax=Bionectria ochroleuca TaxID=29856 RepID=A0ABY6UZW4_BIOOC|nr:unnamed protein product [Clonostachys rosea]